MAKVRDHPVRRQTRDALADRPHRLRPEPLGEHHVVLEDQDAGATVVEGVLGDRPMGFPDRDADRPEGPHGPKEGHASAQADTVKLGGRGGRPVGTLAQRNAIRRLDERPVERGRR